MLPEGMVRLALNLFKASAAPEGQQRRKENINGGIKNMRRSKGMQLGAMLTAVLLVSMAFVPAVSAQAAEKAEEVPIGIARDIAKAQLQYAVMQKMVAGWDGAHVGNFEKRHTSDGELTAYDFKVEKGGKVVGQILVNALRSNLEVCCYKTYI